nr:putative uncharacterized protein C6orf52 homolog [Cavia porcellus]
MARWENFAGFGIAQENNYFYYWQRVKPELPPRHGYHCAVCDERALGFYTLPRGGFGCAVAGNGPQLVYQVTGHPAGTSAPPQETKLKTKFPAEGQDEDSLKDPNRPLDIEELNKEFMAKSEELYDALMDCHWQPLDTVYSSISQQASE